MRRRRGEEGQALVLVLLLSMLLVGSLTVAVSLATASLSVSSQYGDSSQASLAALGGINVELANIRNVTYYTSLPCSLSGTESVPGAASSYSVSVQYAANGTNLTCSGPGSTLGGLVEPTTATLISTGTAAHVPSVQMEENIAIAASDDFSALGYAIFTPNSLFLSGSENIDNSGSNVANMYSGGTLTCGTGDTTQGSVITYQSITMTGSCQVNGNLGAAGAVSLQASAKVSGNVTSYAPITTGYICSVVGTCGITMSGSTSIGGTATAANWTITGSSSSTNITGNAYAYGAINMNGGSDGAGSISNDAAVASDTVPGQITFPILNPTVAQWQAAGWNVYQVPNSTYTSCTGSSGFFANNSSGAADPFMNLISTANQKTVVYAPTCAVSYSRTHVFDLSADVALQVQTISMAGSNTFQSTTSTAHDLAVLANGAACEGSGSCQTNPTAQSCSTDGVYVTFSNQTTFSSTVPVFIDSPGQVDYANNQAMYGDIQACGGFDGTNSFTLDFVPTGANLPWGGSLAPTETVLNKYILKG